MNTFIFILSIVVAVICLLIVPTIILKRKKLLIYNTPAVVVEIKKIAEFVTTCFFEEKIMIERKPKHKLAGFILDKLDKDGSQLKPYWQNVKSGDTDNREGIAAKIYWDALFGDDFMRYRSGDSPNEMLNYGYTVLSRSIITITTVISIDYIRSSIQTRQYK